MIRFDRVTVKFVEDIGQVLFAFASFQDSVRIWHLDKLKEGNIEAGRGARRIGEFAVVVLRKGLKSCSGRIQEGVLTITLLGEESISTKPSGANLVLVELAGFLE